jgi:hypothetical protein
VALYELVTSFCFEKPQGEQTRLPGAPLKCEFVSHEFDPIDGMQLGCMNYEFIVPRNDLTQTPSRDNRIKAC